MTFPEAYGQNQNNNNQNNNNYNGGEVQFFIGPYCDTQSSNLYLGAFYDEYCSNPADTSYFMSMNYGNGFPYFYDPIIATNTCVSCQNMDENGGNNGDDDGYPEPNELCQASTEEALYQCDAGRGYEYGCYFLSTTLPCMDGNECPTDDGYGDNDGAGGGNSSSGAADSSTRTVKNQLEKWYSWNGLEDREKTMVLVGLASVIVLLIAGVVLCTCCCCRRNQQSDKQNPLLGRTNGQDIVVSSSYLDADYITSDRSAA